MHFLPSLPEDAAPEMGIPLSAIIIAQVHAKDHKAFEQLYEYYKKPLWRHLYYLVNNQEVACDLFQETLLRVWKSASTRNLAADFDLWLYCIAKNLAIDYLRSTNRHIWLPLPEKGAESEPESLLPLQLQVVGLEEHICERTVLQNALARMSPQYRVCVLLQDLWGYSQKEIAEMLGINEKTVSSNISRGHRQLRVLYWQSPENIA